MTTADKKIFYPGGLMLGPPSFTQPPENLYSKEGCKYVTVQQLKDIVGKQLAITEQILEEKEMFEESLIRLCIELGAKSLSENDLSLITGKYNNF